MCGLFVCVCKTVCPFVCSVTSVYHILEAIPPAETLM